MQFRLRAADMLPRGIRMIPRDTGKKVVHSKEGLLLIQTTKCSLESLPEALKKYGFKMTDAFFRFEDNDEYMLVFIFSKKAVPLHKDLNEKCQASLMERFKELCSGGWQVKAWSNPGYIKTDDSINFNCGWGHPTNKKRVLTIAKSGLMEVVPINAPVALAA